MADVSLINKLGFQPYFIARRRWRAFAEAKTQVATTTRIIRAVPAPERELPGIIRDIRFHVAKNVAAFHVRATGKKEWV